MYICNKKILLQKEIVQRKLPNNIDKYDYKIFKIDLKEKINKVYYYKINNFIFFINNTFYIKSKKLLFDFLQIENISKFQFVKKILLLIFFFSKQFIKFSSKTKYIKRGIIIHNRQSNGYFHWINDVLLKVIIIKKLKIFNKFPVILPKNLNSSFHFDSLRLLNINFIVQKNNLKIKEAIYIPDVSPSGSPRPKLVNLLRNNLIKKNNTNKNQKIYISRKKSRRSIFNEPELIKILLKYNFKIYFMEDLKIVDQISLCNSAKIVIGMHGAGLTNCIWMKKNTTLIEIRPRDELYLNCYFTLSNILRLKYYYFFCDKKSIFKTINNAEYSLDLEKFEKEFYKILKL